MFNDMKQRAMALPPYELRELDQLLDANPRLVELLMKMFPEMESIIAPMISGGPQQPTPGAAGPAQGASGPAQVTPGAGLYGSKVY